MGSYLIFMIGVLFGILIVVVLDNMELMFFSPKGKSKKYIVLKVLFITVLITGCIYAFVAYRRYTNPSVLLKLINDHLELAKLITSLLTMIISVISVLLVVKSIRGNTYASVTERSLAINRILMEYDDELSDLWESLEGINIKGDQSDRRKSWVISSLLDFYENIFYQHRVGNIPPGLWQGWKTQIVESFTSSKHIQEQWERSKNEYWDLFRTFVDRELNKTTCSADKLNHRFNKTESQ